MTDDSTNPSTNEPEPQAAIASLHTPSPVTTPPVAAPAVVKSDITPPNATPRIPTRNVTPQIEEVPQRDTVLDPRVVALRAMFPDYDDLILCVRSIPCLPINQLPIHITIAGYRCLNLWAETKIAPLMHYSV
jgi:hypothetical protein